MSQAHVIPAADVLLRAHDPRLKHTLDLLLEAHECARELGQDPWQFALKLTTLREEGLTTSLCRWLLSEGYVRKAVETTRLSSRQRTFCPVAHLELPPRSCFVLTEAGVELAHLIAAATGTDRPAGGSADPPTLELLQGLKPSWRADVRELWLGPYLVKAFHQPAPCQILLLTALEEEGWPPRIDNPFPKRGGIPAPKRLLAAIKKINRKQICPLLRFHGDGTGQGVR